MNCLHLVNSGACGLGLHPGRVSPGTCFRCPQYDGPSRGVGDTVAKMLDSVGVRKCGKCRERQAKLNERVPYDRHSAGVD